MGTELGSTYYMNHLHLTYLEEAEFLGRITV